MREISYQALVIPDLIGNPVLSSTYKLYPAPAEQSTHKIITAPITLLVSLVQIIDRYQQNWKNLITAYSTVIQNYRKKQSRAAH